ncbi:DUF4395 domain-containing protein [Chitinophaga pendula]|uniref:DUF4395 domain-containing protein n=1 Tax=Chitinophaga TaxID=79328 RepID=UPI000BB05232|nr:MULTISPECIES: DUF4395 domain-containing protein [Chitinophaga]ASZ12503.1 hypothetical protein CK934_16835 [Chitinophaga sp. MD30]UCJ09893.1 DUF4395 domain-containing protein [Chitinophaga pendula]
MNNVIQFGERVAGYEIPVLNEREIRASAGILFLVTYTSLLFILFDSNFIPIKYVIPSFLLDLLIRVFINPKYSPSIILGRLMVRNQVPEYVGAKQKRFAWSIGIVLSATMTYFFLIENAYSPITGVICLICLLFLFFEAAFGICLGCLVYPLFFRNTIQHCPGEICDRKERQPIQRVSLVQLSILLVLAGILFLAPRWLHERFSQPPHDLFKSSATAKSR